MRTKILPIVLPPTLYTLLELDGRAEERDALQQARWILKCHLVDRRYEKLTDQKPATSPAASEVA